MPNIMDYLDWRGDLSFSSAPFNEVDNLILSELAFIDFSEVVSENFSETVTLHEAARRLSVFSEEDSVKTGVLLPKEILPLFKKAAESHRFSGIALSGYEARTEASCEVQFAAVTMLLGNGTVFVSYRGTDDTLVGWKEDFNMSFLSVIPSQSLAVQYLDRMAAVYSQQILLGGHSKGGNLAVYAAACTSADTQHRILRIYNNDGPGFSRPFLDSSGYMRIRDRVRTIVPQTSIVGMLLEHECAYTIVKSTQSGLFQHDGFSWEVLGDAFVSLSDRSSESKFIDRTLKNWVAAISSEERERFVETLYAILSSTRAETLSDIRADKDALMKILKGITPEHRTVLQKTLRDLIYEGHRVLRADREEKRTEKKEEKLRRRVIEEEEKQRKKAMAEEERRLKKEQEAELRLQKQKKQNALMVAVRPIRFHIVKAETPVKKKTSYRKAL